MAVARLRRDVEAEEQASDRRMEFWRRRDADREAGRMATVELSKRELHARLEQEKQDEIRGK
jgi:hypothetical protein